MIIRTQAALRAISALEEEVAPPLAQLDDVEQIGQKSEAISKLAQSRAATSSNGRNRASPLPRGSVDRAPLSPLAEITNTVSRPFRTLDGSHIQSAVSSQSAMARGVGMQLTANMTMNHQPQPPQSQTNSFQNLPCACSIEQIQEKENRSKNSNASDNKDTRVIQQSSPKRVKEQHADISRKFSTGIPAENHIEDFYAKHTSVDGIFPDDNSQSPSFRSRGKKMRVGIQGMTPHNPVDKKSIDMLAWDGLKERKSEFEESMLEKQAIAFVPCKTNLPQSFKIPNQNCPAVQNYGALGDNSNKQQETEVDILSLRNSEPAIKMDLNCHESEIENLSAALKDVWGAGISLSVGNDGIFEVSAIIPGGPAQREGVAVGDLVFEAGFRELRGLNSNEVNKILVGSLGSTINLVVWRYGYSSPCRMSLVREMLVSAAHSEEFQNDPVEAINAEPAIASCVPKACLSCSDSEPLKMKGTVHHQEDKDSVLNRSKCTEMLVNRVLSRESFSSDDSKDISVDDDDDWILSWSVEEVCTYFQSLRLSGEGLAEAAERALLVERYLIDGTILYRAINHGDGENWLANTLALAPNKVLELKTHLSKVRLLREKPNICTGQRHNHSAQPHGSVGSQPSESVGAKRPAIFKYSDFYRNSSSTLKCDYVLDRENSDMVPHLNSESGKQGESAHLGADVSRRRVREWSASDVLAFLRDLVPYSSVKDTEFRNENIRRYHISGRTFLEHYLDDDEFLQTKLLLMPAQAARARSILKSYSTQNVRKSMSAQQGRTTISPNLCGHLHSLVGIKNFDSNVQSDHETKTGESQGSFHRCPLFASEIFSCAEEATDFFWPNLKRKSRFHLQAVTIPSNTDEHDNIGIRCQNIQSDMSDEPDAETWYAASIACRLDSGDRDAQYAILQKALHCNSQHVNSLCDCGVLMQESFKNFELARIFYERALASDPNHVTSLCNCAILYAQELNNPKQAKDLYERALQVDPDNILAMHSLATLLSDFSGDFDGAKGLYEQVLRLDRDYVPTLCNYGALLDSVYGDYERSIEIYEHALKICPHHSLTLCNFGALLNDVKKDYSASEALFCKSLQADPTHVSTLCNYGWLQMDGLNNPMAAWALFERALLLEPTHAQTLFNYGCLLEKNSIFEGAGEMYRKAIECNPGLTSCRRQYASFLISIKNDSRAAAAILKDMTATGHAVTPVSVSNSEFIPRLLSFAGTLELEWISS